MLVTAMYNKKVNYKGALVFRLHNFDHHKHQGLDPLIRSVSKVIVALSNVF